MSDLREELAPWQRANKALLEEIVNACGFSHYDECDGVLALIARVRAEEREEAAKVADNLAFGKPPLSSHEQAWRIAAAIRGRK